MASVTPARIIYNDEGGNPQVLRFHAVITEAHEASTEITSFPVQTGFNISNHAIRKNRKITIEAVITNTLLATSANPFVYSSNNTRTVFDIIKYLVNSAKVCEVLTNLGLYEPVVFTKFSTKQAAGMVDSMKVVMSGEELQVKGSLNQTAPKILAFTVVDSEDYEATITELASTGIVVPVGAVISKTKTNVGSSFALSTPNAKGINTTTTYVAKSYDPVTQTYDYEVHTNPDEVVQEEPKTGFNFFSLAGAVGSAVSPCLVEGAIKIAVDNISDVVQTSMGDLRKSVYGYKSDLVKMGGGKTGQALIGMGVDCVIVGAEAGFDNAAEQLAPGSAIDKVQGLPETQDIIDGVTRAGAAISAMPLKEVTLTKISGFGGNLPSLGGFF